MNSDSNTFMPTTRSVFEEREVSCMEEHTIGWYLSLAGDSFRGGVPRVLLVAQNGYVQRVCEVYSQLMLISGQKLKANKRHRCYGRIREHFPFGDRRLAVLAVSLEESVFIFYWVFDASRRALKRLLVPPDQSEVGFVNGALRELAAHFLCCALRHRKSKASRSSGV